MARNYSNIAFDTTLVAGIGAGDLSLVVASASGWPAVPFAAVLDPGLVTEEVIQVTNKAGTTFTITRGFDGTTAAAHALGATVRHSAIAGDFTDLQAADTAEASTRATADSALSTAISNEASTRAAADALLTPMARTLTINGVTLDLSANRSWTVSAGSGTVTSVDLTVPGVLFSVSGNPVTTSGTLALSLLTQTANTVLAGPTSGGAATPTMRALVAADIPAISLTAGVSGILPSANGGTGVNNAGTLTNATNTTITGGGTLALAGFTLTVPATGSAALLATANVFTAAQTITSAAANALAVGPNGDTNPALRVVANVASAITGLSITGNASGAGVTLTALGGTNESIILTPKGTGQVIVPQGAAATPSLAFAGDTGTGIARIAGLALIYSGAHYLAIGGGVIKTYSSATIGWTSAATPATGTYDTALGRNAAAVVEVNNGTGGQWGSLKAGTRDAGTTTITDGLTLGHQSTGTPAAGLGTGIQLNINSSTTADQNAARITAEWADATHATRKARAKLNVYDTATREVLRGEADGTNPMIGFLGAAATARVAITGSRAGNAALASLLTELASKGLITDSTSA